LTIGIAIGGCVAPFHPRSANPYEPDRGPSSSGGGAVGFAPAIAVAESIHRRIDGECYVPCLKGTRCNNETGLCDPLPCRGECKKGEYCDESGFIPRCVAEPIPGLIIETEAPAPKEKEAPADAPRVESQR
jgi:hypothetical protein